MVIPFDGANPLPHPPLWLPPIWPSRVCAATNGRLASHFSPASLSFCLISLSLMVIPFDGVCNDRKQIYDETCPYYYKIKDIQFRWPNLDIGIKVCCFLIKNSGEAWQPWLTCQIWWLHAIIYVVCNTFRNVSRQWSPAFHIIYDKKQYLMSILL